jgi:hypothetical protein
MLLSFHYGEEAIADQIAIFAAECGRAVRQEYFALAVVGGMEQELACCRTAGYAFTTNFQVESAQGNPRGFAAPSSLQELCAKGQDGAKLFTGHGRKRALEAGGELQIGDVDSD